MKYISRPPADTPLTIEAMHVFDPWPFAEDEVKTAPAVAHLYQGVMSRPGGGPFVLHPKECALAVLSDGTVAVCSRRAHNVGDTVTRTT